MNKIESAPKVDSLQDLKEEMRPGDIIFQGRIRNLEAGLQPYLMSGLMQIGQKVPIMHSAMVGFKDKILDYGTGGVNYIKDSVPVRGFKEISLKDLEAGDRLIALARVKGADGKDAAKKFIELAKKKKFDASKSLKVGINKLVGKHVFDIKPQGDFCSTIVDKSIPEIHVKGPARPVDILEQNNVDVVAVYDPLEKKAFDSFIDELQKIANEFSSLKKHKVPLTDDERAKVMSRGAVWHHGPNGEETPAVWKSEHNGKTVYVTNTHRCWGKASTVKGAINKYHKKIKGTA